MPPAARKPAVPRVTEAALRRLTAAWPGIGAEIKWGNDLVFMVDGKMFCALCVEGEEKGKLAFKVEPERFLELTDRPGIVPAPYLARAHWVALADSRAVPRVELEGLVRRAYELVFAKLTKKRQNELGG
jgi:predicted DNA-binding protein (MmcQ/YjbR family)